MQHSRPAVTGATHGQVHGRACASVCASALAHDHVCAIALVHGVALPGLRSFVIFWPLYIVFSSYFGETSWLAFHERKLEFRIPPKTPLGGD